MAAPNSKRAKIEEGNVADGELVASFEKLLDVQDELKQIKDNASDALNAAERKYSNLRKPIIKKRKELEKSIPNFWRTAFVSHPALGYMVIDEDLKIFKYLSNLEYEESEDVISGFSITLHFNPNPYFENAELKKTFAFLNDRKKRSIFFNDRTKEIATTPIIWKEGKGLPTRVNHGDENENRRKTANESFFRWFSADCDDDETKELHDEIHLIIKEDLWHCPLNYFKEPNMEALRHFDEDDDDDDDDDADADDDDDDHDEDEEGQEEAYEEENKDEEDEDGDGDGDNDGDE